MARIAAPFGIKGWVKLQTFTQYRDSLNGYATWLVERAGVWEKYELEDFAVNAKGVIAKLKGCDDRNAAQLLAKRQVGIPRADLEAVGEGEIFWIDLIGCRVINQTGEVLGQVDSLMETGANDVLVVKADAGREILIPYVPEFILNIDRALKTITVDWQRDYG